MRHLLAWISWSAFFLFVLMAILSWTAIGATYIGAGTVCGWLFMASFSLCYIAAIIAVLEAATEETERCE